MIPLNPTKTSVSPRQIIAEHFTSLGKELPIHGGWGYTKDDACIIDKFDPSVDLMVPFNGVGIEYIFVEKRIYEELIICRPNGERFAGIEWSLLHQELIVEGARQFDKLTFEIRAFPEKDWEYLKAAYEGPKGVASPKFDHAAHEKERQERVVFLTREYWFDITSFYGQGLIIKNLETGEPELIASGDNGFDEKTGRLFVSDDHALNIELVDYQRKIFDVLGLFRLHLPQGFNWYCEDLAEANAKGAIFRTWEKEEPGQYEMASIIIADVTEDPTEPEISGITQADVATLDDLFKEEISEQLNSQGRAVVQWQSSQLNETQNLTALVTAYIVGEDQRQQQNIALRMAVTQRKFVLMGRFDVDKHELLAKPVFESLQNVSVIVAGTLPHGDK